MTEVSATGSHRHGPTLVKEFIASRGGCRAAKKLKPEPVGSNEQAADLFVSFSRIPCGSRRSSGLNGKSKSEPLVGPCECRMYLLQPGVRPRGIDKGQTPDLRAGSTVVVRGAKRQKRSFVTTFPAPQHFNMLSRTNTPAKSHHVLGGFSP